MLSILAYQPRALVTGMFLTCVMFAASALVIPSNAGLARGFPSRSMGRGGAGGAGGANATSWLTVKRLGTSLIVD